MPPALRLLSDPPLTHLNLPELYVLRHGETVWNRDGRMQGGQDSPLTALGREQAAAMGRLLARRGVSLRTHDILCSPQGRAVATARLIMAQLDPVPDLPQDVPHLDPRLREISMGLWAGLTHAEIAARWPGPPDEHFLAFYARAPQAEGFDALWARVSAVLAGLRRPAVIVTHGMTSRSLRTAALGHGLGDLDKVAGGQGCIHHLNDGVHATLGADDLHAPAPQATSST